NRPASSFRRGLLLGLALGIATAPGNAAATESFVVIVNSANPVASLTAEEVSDLFFKKTMTWPGGTSVFPIDLSERFPAREAFSQRIHYKSTKAVRSHWLKMIFSGQGIPPPENNSAEATVAFVSA